MNKVYQGFGVFSTSGWSTLSFRTKKVMHLKKRSYHMQQKVCLWDKKKRVLKPS